MSDCQEDQFNVCGNPPGKYMHWPTYCNTFNNTASG